MHSDYQDFHAEDGDALDVNRWPDGHVMVALTDSRGQRVSLFLTPALAQFLADSVKAEFGEVAR